MESFDFDGMRIAYVARGSGEPVVMLHNAGASHKIWHAQIDALSATRRVYALDLLGYGDSDRPVQNHYSLRRYVEMLEAFVAHAGLPRLSIVGNCLGSAISLAYTREHPGKVAAVIACNPLTYATASHGDLSPLVRFALWAPAWVASILGKVPTPRVGIRGVARYYWFARPSATAAHRTDIAEVRPHPSRALIDMVRDLKSFTALDEWDRSGPDETPVCTIWGLDNHVLSADAGRRLNETLRPARQEWLQPAAHAVMMEWADEVTAIVGGFLDAHHPVTATVDG